MDKYISGIKRFINKNVNKQNTKEFLLNHKNTLIVIVAIILLGGITTIISYAYFTIVANQAIVGGQVGSIANINMYYFVEDKNASTGAGLGTYSKSVYLPRTTYTYNSSLSYCKHGSTLSYNASTYTFTVSKTKDACYAYFDVSEAKNADIILNIYAQKNGEYKLVNEIPHGTFTLNNTSSCTNGATMSLTNGEIVVNTSNKTVCNAYLDGQIIQPRTRSIYRKSSTVLANYESSAASSYPSSISGLTLNTDYYNQPNSSWGFYLKHDIQGNDIIRSYVCFDDNGVEVCLEGGNYSETYHFLVNSSYNCEDSTTFISCDDNIYANSAGLVGIDDDIIHCTVDSDGRSSCM